MKWKQCRGTRRNGRPCWFRGVVEVDGQLYCRRHSLPALNRDEQPTRTSLRVLRKLVARYRAGSLKGAHIDYEHMWATAVTHLLKEVDRLRRK